MGMNYGPTVIDTPASDPKTGCMTNEPILVLGATGKTGRRVVERLNARGVEVRLGSRSEQPPLSLESYPLPDGNWHWVSRCWMIDMRTDTGEVQHDGFEYNWFFRRHNWRAQIGSFNAGRSA